MISSCSINRRQRHSVNASIWAPVICSPTKPNRKEMQPSSFSSSLVLSQTECLKHSPISTPIVFRSKERYEERTPGFSHLRHTMPSPNGMSRKQFMQLCKEFSGEHRMSHNGAAFYFTNPEERETFIGIAFLMGISTVNIGDAGVPMSDRYYVTFNRSSNDYAF